MSALLEALRVLMLAPCERLSLAQKMAGSSQCPPWLDDEVLDTLSRKGYISYREGEHVPGDLVASVGNKVLIGEVTDKGRLAYKEGKTQ